MPYSRSRNAERRPRRSRRRRRPELPAGEIALLLIRQSAKTSSPSSDSVTVAVSIAAVAATPVIRVLVRILRRGGLPICGGGLLSRKALGVEPLGFEAGGPQLCGKL